MKITGICGLVVTAIGILFLTRYILQEFVVEF